jgi:hypothetical protein
VLPNSSTIQASQAGKLPLHPSLLDNTTTAHVLDEITNSSLISIVQLCDDDCIAVFAKSENARIQKQNLCTIGHAKSNRRPLGHSSGCHIAVTVSLAPTTSVPFAANAIIRKDMTKTVLAQYLYGCCGSLVLSTWQQGIRNGNFVTWPGIDSFSIDKHLPKSITSAKGHLNQERKNLQSTKK